MKRLLIFGTMMIGFAWSVTAVWVAGYSSGYDDGASNAWDSARKSLVYKPNSEQDLDHARGRELTQR